MKHQLLLLVITLSLFGIHAVSAENGHDGAASDLTPASPQAPVLRTKSETLKRSELSGVTETIKWR